MQLAVLTQYYPPEVGAPQARLSELASHFIARGHGVTVLTAMPNYPTGRVHPGYGGVVRREQIGGARVIRSFIYPTQRADYLHRLTNYCSFVASSAVVGSMMLDRPDFLLVESPPLFLGLSAVWLSRVKRTRLIFNVSDLWPETAVHLGVLRDGSRAHRASARLEAYLYSNAWLVTGQSQGILQSISARFPDRPVFHLSNGVDTTTFSPERGTAAARASIAPAERCIALYAGLHGLAQGLDQVLGAADLLREDDRVAFALVGDGPEKAQLVSRAGALGLTNVGFHPSRPKSEIPSLLASADIVLVTLKTHIPGAVPSKLYEAMASGRPVVLVASGEPAEIVLRHRAGIVVAPGDVAGLAAAVRTLAADAALRLELGGNGRRAAEAHFDRAAIMGRFASHLESHATT